MALGSFLHRLSPSRRRRRGASAIEFALMMPVISLLVFGAMDLSWFISTRYDVQRAAREGARIGSTVLLKPEDDDVLIRNAAELRAFDVLSSRGSPCATGCTIETELFMFEGYQHLRVTVVYPHSALFPNLGIVQPFAVGQFVMLTQQQ